MVLIGGVGTVFGPVVGAFAVVFGSDYISSEFPMGTMFALGVALIGVTHLVAALSEKGGRSHGLGRS